MKCILEKLGKNLSATNFNRISVFQHTQKENFSDLQFLVIFNV